MIYEYECRKCEHVFQVVKSMKESDTNEFCDRCGSPGYFFFTPPHITGAKVEHAEYNYGLGAVVKNKRHRQELAKRKGVVEIGNDYKSGENMLKESDRKREDAAKKRWEDD